MNNNFKTLVTILLSIIIVFSTVKPVNASISDDLDSKNSEKLSAIDSLIDQRNKAFLNGDSTATKEIDSKLNNAGLINTTYKELSEMVPLPDNINGINTSRSSISAAAAAEKNKFSYSYFTYTYNGKLYDVMYVYVYPLTTSSNLYQSSVTGVQLKNSKQAAANAISLIKITASSLAGFASNTLSTAQTVYSAFSSVLSPSTTVQNISSSYTWNCAQTCNFCFIKSRVTNSYVQASQWAKVNSTVTVVTPLLIVGSNSSTTSASTKTYTGTVTPDGYGETMEAIKSYNVGIFHIARVSSISIKGISGQTVKNININNLEAPAAIN